MGDTFGGSLRTLDRLMLVHGNCIVKCGVGLQLHGPAALGLRETALTDSRVSHFPLRWFRRWRRELGLPQLNVGAADLESALGHRLQRLLLGGLLPTLQERRLAAQALR